MYFKNIFHPNTLENLFRTLNNSIYFQNIVVCNKPLKTASLGRLILTFMTSRTV